MQTSILARSLAIYRTRSSILVVMLFSLIIVACQLPEGLEVPQSPLLAALERKSGLIAYVGADGNIYTMDQGGGNVVAITDDAQVATEDDRTTRVYQHPTWSPDSESLAFFSLEIDQEEGNQQSGVWSSTVESDPEVSELFSSNNDVPFYSYWSPDGKKLGFLSASQASTTMLFNLVDEENEHQILDAAQPYYWNWAPDSTRLIIHAGSSSREASVERLSFLDIASDGQVLESVLEPQLSYFQAPAWSPTGEWLLFAIQKDEERSLVLADRFGTIEQTLLKFDDAIAFGFSPDGNKVAAIVGPVAENGLVVGSLHVFNLATPEVVFVTEEENVISFFWAPNSNDLAYFPLQIIDPSGGEEGAQANQQPLATVSIQAYTHSQGETRELVTNFVPTRDFINVLIFFNQYQHSATIWSPDSQNIVFPIQTQEAPVILVVSATGSLEPRPLATGVLAFWSWD